MAILNSRPLLFNVQMVGEWQEFEIGYKRKKIQLNCFLSVLTMSVFLYWLWLKLRGNHGKFYDAEGWQSIFSYLLSVSFKSDTGVSTMLQIQKAFIGSLFHNKIMHFLEAVAASIKKVRIERTNRNLLFVCTSLEALGQS